MDLTIILSAMKVIGYGLGTLGPGLAEALALIGFVVAMIS